MRVNGRLLPIEEINDVIANGSMTSVQGDVVKFSMEVTTALDDDLTDAQQWIAGAIGALTPAYYALTPPLSVFVAGLPENEELSYPEGAASYRMHRRLERDPRVIEKAKSKFKAANDGRLFCEVCGFDFFSSFGERGRDYAEGHHIRPVSQMAEGETTQVTDIAIVCSNCHSMLHRRPFTTPAVLRKIVEGGSNSR